MNRIPTLFTLLLLLGGCSRETSDHDNPSSNTTGPSAAVTLKGEARHLEGQALKAGDQAPEVLLTSVDDSDFSLNDLRGTGVVISVVPVLNTQVCTNQTLRLDVLADHWDGVELLTVSRDTPFALAQWVPRMKLKNTLVLTDYKRRTFGPAFGVHMKEDGLLARSVFVVDAAGVIRYIEVVGDLAREPDYDTLDRKVRALAGK